MGIGTVRVQLFLGESQRVLVDEASKTAEARRVARKMAASIGLDETVAEQALVVVTEACTNVLKHAGRGELILHAAAAGGPGTPLLEALVLDQGPGIRNLSECLQDGYSTQGTAGHGLGAIIRLSKRADFYSVPGKGTAVLARWGGAANGHPARDQHRLQVSAVNLPKPGQEVSGDAWAVEQHGDQLTLLVADGLGHGMEAHLASTEAVRILRQNPDLRPKPLLERCHQALRSTRGAAMAIAQIDEAHGKITFAGAGNISGRIYSGSALCQNAVSVNGTVGQQTERIQEFYYPWPSDGVLQLHSDGLSSRASLEPYPGLALRDAALNAGVLYRDFARGRDDATVVIIKAA